MPHLAEARSPAPTSPSFDAIFEGNASFVWRALRHLGVRDAELKDLSQEVFLVVHRRLHTFDPTSPLRSWLYGICLRVASDYRRRAHHRHEIMSVDLPDQAEAPHQDDHVELQRSLAWLDGVLDSLDEAKRAVFVAHEIEQLPIADIAAAVGCPIPTAYGRLYAARRVVEAAARREQLKRSPT